MPNSENKKLGELSALQKAALAYKKVRQELDNVLSEPIAIVGMACRLPGNVNSPEEYWNLLIRNKDAIIDVPSNRWNPDQYYDPDKNIPGKMYVKKGGFLQVPIDEFDADFFHISPKEAEDMDPQQRLALEVAVEAIQSAEINSTDLMRSLTGVYMGICFNDYGHLITESGHVEAVDNYYSTGNHYSVLSGRISYFFGLQGPSISMDTACSSSLVSIDAAVKDLRLKRCNLALAGGVNLMLAPEPTINFCKSGMLSPEGHCKTFDESADGYVRGEGCGIIVLKRLSDAIKDNNTILALIRGTAVNQDGPSSGLTVPNGLAQEAVIKAALENAKAFPIEIQYVEAHGTGTSLGDPIEVEALKNSYTKGREKNHPLRIGSVKTNIGHTEAVAGVASIMKVALSLLHEKIPATLHFKKLNPKIALDQAPLEIASQNAEWKREENTKRLAGVSSFGFSGTNAHIILEEGPPLSSEEWGLLKKRLEQQPQFDRRRYWPRFLDDLQKNKEKSQIHKWFYRVQWIEHSEVDKLKAFSEVRRYLVFGNKAKIDGILGDDQDKFIFSEPKIHDCNEIIRILSEDKIKNEITDVLYFANYDTSCETLLYVIQALIEVGMTPRVWILTENAQEITGQEINFNPIQSQLLGFAKVIALEHPEFHCVRIDYDPSMTYLQLVEELNNDGKEDEVAIRENKRYVPRLIPAHPQYKKAFSISSEGSYLITGGLGGLGLACAEWLLTKGAENIILTARSDPTEAVQARLNKYRENGSLITIIKNDVGDKLDVDNLFITLRKDYPPLKGVIHAAGLVDNDFISKQNWERFSKVLRAKVNGTQNLAEALKLIKNELDFFVLFSSVSGVLGSASTSSYAAANYFLNEYAKFARKEGLPATSIAWGPWSSVGMLSGQEERESHLGYQLISPEEGIEAMEIVLKSDEICPVIIPMNWPKYFENLQYVANIYSDIQLSLEKPVLINDELGVLLETAKPEARPNTALEYVRKSVKQVLGLNLNESIDDGKGFFEMGMDSLMTVELRNKLQNALGDRCTLKSTIAFDYPTIQALTQHILIQAGFEGDDTKMKAEIESSLKNEKEKEIKSKVDKLTEQNIMEELKKQIERRKKNEQ